MSDRGQPLLRLLAVLVGGALLAAGLPAAAKTGQVQTLAVRGAAAGPKIQPMRMFWKKRLGEDTKTTLLGAATRTVSVPGSFYVGTQLSSGRSSVHRWTFASGFLQSSGAREGLRLALNADSNVCFAPDDIRRMGARYDAARSTNELLSGAILFGHLREVCRAKDTATAQRGAEEAFLQVAAIYKILTEREPRSFTGRICQVSRTEVTC